MTRLAWMQHWIKTRHQRNCWESRFTNRERMYADWRDAPIDGWPPPDGRIPMRFEQRHVRFVVAGRVYSDEEERRLHWLQDRSPR